MDKPKIIFLVGPTASGKTDIAICLAKKINAEIISCDSMQVYKGLDIITSKPSLALRRKVKHHLIGEIPLGKEYNVSLYRKSALSKVREIYKKGKTPLFTGGTGLYMSILVDGIFELKVQDDKIRQRLYKEADEMGSNFLHDRLAEIDPEAARKIHPNDKKRIIRALEVFEITGKPISVLQKQRKGLSADYDVRVFCLNMQTDLLRSRINKRVEQMFKQGAVKEVKTILKKLLSKTASVALGVREIKGYLDGDYDLETAKNILKHNTCLYAKRQMTWFRKDKRINWINVSASDKPQNIAGKILRELFL